MAAHKSMLETAVELLKRKRNPQKFNKIFKEVSETLGLTEEEKEKSKARFYNDLSLSAIFIYTGNDEWDLKERQPIELWDKDASYFIDPEELKALKAQRQKEKLEAKKREEERAEALKKEQEKSDIIVEKLIQNDLLVSAEQHEQKEDTKEDVEEENKPKEEVNNKETNKEETDKKKKSNDDTDDLDDDDEDNNMMDEKDYNKYMDDYEDLYEDE